MCSVRKLYVIFSIYAQLFGAFCALELSESDLRDKQNSLYDRVYPGLFQNSSGTKCSSRFDITENDSNKWLPIYFSIVWFDQQLLEMEISLSPSFAVNIIVENLIVDLLHSVPCNSSDLSNKVIRKLKDYEKHLRCPLFTNFLYLRYSLTNISLNGGDLGYLCQIAMESDCQQRFSILDLSRNAILHLPNLLTELSNITIFNLSYNEITTVDAEAFDYLTNISWIDFCYNNLTHLPLKLFQFNLKLEVLDLSDNRLIDDVWIALSSLNELTHLVLDRNNINSITHTINSLPKLRFLSVKSNKLTRLDINLSLFNLEFLILSGNELNFISEGGLSNLQVLKELDLSANKIVRLNSSTFVNLTALEVLDISNNVINHIEPSAFHHTAVISLVNLTGNRISSVNKAFAEANIKRLDLSGNRMRTLTFSQFPQSLEELKLVNNDVELLLDNRDCVQHLETRTMSLKSLILSGNKMRSVEGACVPTSVQSLDLSFNSIEAFSFLRTYRILYYNKKVNLTKVSLISNRISKIYYSAILTHKTKVVQYEFGGNPLECSCYNAWLTDGFKCQNRTRLAKSSISDLNQLRCASGSAKLPGNLKSLIFTSICSNATFINKFCQSITQCLDFCTCNEMNVTQVMYSNANLTHVPRANPTDIQVSVVIRLDGNNINAINDGDLSNYSNAVEMYLNRSNVNAISENAFDGLERLTVLNLADNSISALQANSLNNLTRLTHLNLSYNSLRSLPRDAFLGLKHLEYVNLQMNELEHIDLNVFKENKCLKEVNLNGNPLLCNCTFVRQIRDFEQKHVLKLELSCFNGNGTEIPFFWSNSSYCTIQIKVLPFYPFVLGSFAGLVAIVSIVFIFRYEIQVLVYSRWRVRFCCNTSDVRETENKNYDAFLLYCNKDLDFLCQQLLPGLERISRPYRCCINERDFHGGEYLTDCVVEAVEQSSRTIVLLSEKFVRSGWCCFGFKLAHVQMLRDKCARVIVVVVGEVPEQVEPEMRFYLKTNAYLRWGERLFWEKLYFEMPHHRVTTPTPQLLPMLQMQRHQRALREEQELD